MKGRETERENGRETKREIRGHWRVGGREINERDKKIGKVTETESEDG